jgi:hypothetical protein
MLNILLAMAVCKTELSLGCVYERELAASSTYSSSRSKNSRASHQRDNIAASSHLIPLVPSDPYLIYVSIKLLATPILKEGAVLTSESHDDASPATVPPACSAWHGNAVSLLEMAIGCSTLASPAG